MKQKNKRHILFRYFIIIGFTMMLVAFITYKLVMTTVVNVDEWEKKAAERLNVEKIVQPERGTIYASNGTILAVDCEYLTIVMNPNANRTKKDTIRKYLPQMCDTLAAIFPGKTAKQWKEDIEERLNRKSKYYCMMKYATPDQFKRLRQLPIFKKRSYRNFVYADPIRHRFKPYGEMATNSIGEIITLKDGRRKGVRGLEMALDSLLYGKAGKTQTVQVTKKIINLATVPAVRGYDVVTTIDVEMQDIVDDELEKMCIDKEAEWASAILMEVSTGEIKAMSNLTWNERTHKYEAEAINALRCYEPGSVIKPISMLIALEDGIVSNIDSVIQTGSSFAYGGARPISDGGHGAASMPVRAVIERSSNIGMSKIILRKYEANPEKWYSRLKSIGFFDKFNSGIGGERIPRVDSLVYHNKAEKRRACVALTRMCYGYTTAIPPLYTLGIYNAIANDGRFVRPRLVKELRREGMKDSIIPVTYVRDRICSAKNAAKLRQMLHDVVWGEHGTGRFVKDKRVELAGKTGTCFLLDGGKYNSQKKRYTFCGFFPYAKPKYSCIVVMSRAKNTSAGRSSGTVMKNVALRLYSRGMLDNSSDYKTENHAGTHSKNKRSVMFAPENMAEIEDIQEEMNISNVAVFKTPDAVPEGKVPSVIGMGLRDAIASLEQAGLNVKVEGMGYVTKQSIKAGTDIVPGQEIILTLNS